MGEKAVPLVVRFYRVWAKAVPVKKITVLEADVRHDTAGGDDKVGNRQAIRFDRKTIRSRAIKVINPGLAT